MISHSSPFEIYESLDCYGKKIEGGGCAPFRGASALRSRAAGEPGSHDPVEELLRG